MAVAMSIPKNIYIIGAQCTGKTTLFNALQHHYSAIKPPSIQPAYIPEIARTVVASLQLNASDIRNCPSKCLELQEAILHAQYHAEQAVSFPKSPWFLSDRSGLDPIVYTQLYVGDGAAERMLASSEWKALESRMKQGLVVLCESGCSWLVDDGTGLRLMPEDQGEWFRTHGAFEKLLVNRGIEYMLVPAKMESLEERVDFVLRCHAFE